MFRTRFAPSPTYYLHLGHALSALHVWRAAAEADGEVWLRIEDIDTTRCQPEYTEAIFRDLHWLGLTWDGPVRRQSEHFAAYEAALLNLAEGGAVYPCGCSRADIAAAASAPQEGQSKFGPDGRIYPGTCRHRSMAERAPRDALRLHLAKAAEALPETVRFDETGPTYAGSHDVTYARLAAEVGDPVLARPHMAASYHFSVVLDDAATGVSHIIRGEDLFPATSLHRFLQALLGLPVPVYHHHRLLRDAAGTRLATRDDARAIRTSRADGASPADIRALVGL